MLFWRSVTRNVTRNPEISIKFLILLAATVVGTAISESVKAGYCEMHGLSCDPSSQALTIDAEYLDANGPVVREQMQKAGVRLAHLLDIAFAQ